MKDYLRAAMTCIIMYHTDAIAYAELDRRSSLLTDARHHCEMYLKLMLNKEEVPKQQASSIATNYRMTMSSQDTHYHMGKIDQQIEIRWIP
jgi:hypothetical protein